MDITTARTFLAAASTGSFVGAARRIHASPSAVTERIKQLEYALRVRLFDRDKRGCRLTPAGRRFVVPAQNMVRAWDQGCTRVGLPPRFARSVRIGGQHALWPDFLMSWLLAIIARDDTLAIRASSAAAVQLNRDLEDDELDIAFLYDPILRKGLRIEQLVPDRLVLLTSQPEMDWRENFARIDWGENANAEISARIGELPNPGLDLDLGSLSLDWLVASGASGYVPERLAWQKIRQGKLSLVDDMPDIEFSPFVCWRESLSRDLVDILVDSAKRQMAGLLE